MADDKFKVSSAYIGLNTDNISSQIKEGQLSFAKNAMVENFDGNMVTYQNEPSNELCLVAKPGYTVIGIRNIIEQAKTILFQLNTTTGDCEIGSINNNTCIYTEIINSKCLAFNINQPIRNVVVKTTNCSTQLYWTDGLNPMRWMDLDDLPFREIPDPNNSYKNIKVIGDVDCNKLQIQPDFSIPQIDIKGVEVGGSLVSGTYQFGIQYSNSLGEGYTSVYGITNPYGIHNDTELTSDFNSPTTKALSIHIEGLDTTGLYDYFNLIAISTINAISTPYVVGIFPIVNSTFDTIYTGNDQTSVKLDMDEIFQRFPYYDTAQDVTYTDQTLLWVDLSVHQKINFQGIANKVKLQWETYKIPYNKFEGYSNPVNTGDLRGYMRDEVYAFELCFVNKNGRYTEGFHIPGPMGKPSDFDIIDNNDTKNYNQDPCDTPIPRKRWEVYNTATKTGFTLEYLSGGNKDCYKGPYEFGEFGHWESSLKYPNNSYIWGNRANMPIMHHKIPGANLCPVHDNNIGGDLSYQHSIYPIGIRIDPLSLYQALESSDLTQQQKDEIVGFKILRGNRANNKSVVAKGILYNVGKYSRDNTDYFYPNYPYNDLRPDPFLSSVEVKDHTGSNNSTLLDGFSSIDRTRYSFFSPDTTFERPTGIDSGYLKLESVEYGISKGHFVEVEDNAKYKFLTRDAIYLAFAAAMASIVSLDSGGGFLGVAPSTTISADSVPSTFASMLEIIKDIAPKVNYGYQFNSIGNYSSSLPITQEGNTIRTISDGSYISSGFQSVASENINNFQRESSVYIKLSDQLPRPQDFGVPEDNSRYTLSQVNNCNAPTSIVKTNISSLYGGIRKVFPDQWGQMYSYETIDTGYFQNLYNNGTRYTSFPTVFGGDVFLNRFGIKRKIPFFLDNTALRTDETDIALNLLGNIGYPVYFYGTNQIDIEIDFENNAQLHQDINILTDFTLGRIAVNIISGGTTPLIAGLNIMVTIFKAYLDTLGVNNLNLDCYGRKSLNETGKAYLYAYGIPYFFVESEVNVDYRQATNALVGNFYPNISTDIPDNWLQEKNVPIIRDNAYIYNKTYSKQNKETHFTHIREDYDPNKTCLYDFPNRVIYSQKSNLEETKNNWLVYRPISYYDLPKNYGKVTAIDGLEDRQLLVRFENKSLLYNVYNVVQNQGGPDILLGNPTFFSQPPLDFADTDIGYCGSQHKLLLKTEAGHLTIDSERGQVFLIRGQQVDDISSRGMSKWFTENLSFKIKESFPDINVDNSFKDIGITGVYDTRNSRFIITKKDYQLLNPSINYVNGSFYLGDTLISIDNTVHFCNVSWTISYSLKTQSWISFHSYIPNYYITGSSYFSSGINNGIYKHAPNTSFQRFYGKIEDYILEYPLSFGGSEEIVGAISDYTTTLKYTSPDVYYEPDETIYFNQAVIYNTQQCTGTLNLVPKPISRLALLSYPKFKSDSKDIIVTKADGIFSFNTFWDIVTDKFKPFYSRPCSIPSLDKIFDTNLDYSYKHPKARIRSKECKIRLIQNKTDQYKLISKFIITETQKSIL